VAKVHTVWVASLALSALGAAALYGAGANSAAQGGDRGYGPPGAGYPLTCSSDDGGRHWCKADTSYGVRMVRQRSGSACKQGYSWGYDSRGVWVDHGCRADFEVMQSDAGYRRRDGWDRDRDRDRDRDNGYGRGYGSGGGQMITCSSDDGGRHYCNADTSGGVRMVNQRSGSACQQGRSWGYDQRGIWVDHGCRADFQVMGYGRGGDRGRGPYDGRDNGYYGSGRSYGNNRGQIVTCSSDDGDRHYCNADTRGGVQLVNQRSGSACQQGRSWGYDQRGIWVDHGCRADFAVGGR
jgi:hypothetical protein